MPDRPLPAPPAAYETLDEAAVAAANRLPDAALRVMHDEATQIVYGVMKRKDEEGNPTGAATMIALEVWKRLSPKGGDMMRISAKRIFESLKLDSLDACVAATARVTEMAMQGEVTLVEAERVQGLIERTAKQRWALDLAKAEELRTAIENMAREVGVAADAHGENGLTWGRHGAQQDVSDAETVEGSSPVVPPSWW